MPARVAVKEKLSTSLAVCSDNPAIVVAEIAPRGVDCVGVLFDSNASGAMGATVGVPAAPSVDGATFPPGEPGWVEDRVVVGVVVAVAAVGGVDVGVGAGVGVGDV